MRQALANSRAQRIFVCREMTQYLCFLAFRNNFFEVSRRYHLVISTEAARLMKPVCNIRPGVGGDISFSLQPAESHVPEGAYEILAAAHLFKLNLFKISEDNKSKEAGSKVSPDTIISAEVNRSSLKFRLHNFETLLNLPALFVYLNDDGNQALAREVIATINKTVFNT